MTLDKIETILLTLALVVPGFLINSVLYLFMPRRKEEKELLLLRFLSFSTLNLVVCLPFVRFLIKGNYLEHRPFLAFALLFLINFVIPILLGFALGVADCYGLVGKILSCKWLRGLNLNPLHPTPSSWDWKFAQVSATYGRWVIVHLKDGDFILGEFAAESFASTDAGERDLYLGKIYKKEENGDWTPFPRSDGILVKADTIKTVEFLHNHFVVDEMRKDNGTNNVPEERSDCPGGEGTHSPAAPANGSHAQFAPARES